MAQPTKKPRKNAWKNQDKKRSKTRVNIGTAFARWKDLLESKRPGLKLDADLATFLLDWYEQTKKPATRTTVITSIPISKARPGSSCLTPTSSIALSDIDKIDWADDSLPGEQAPDCDEYLPQLNIRSAVTHLGDDGVKEQSTFLNQHNVYVDVNCLLQLFKNCGRCSCCDCVVKWQGNIWNFSVIQHCVLCNQRTTWNSQNSDTRKTSIRNENRKKGLHNGKGTVVAEMEVTIDSDASNEEDQEEMETLEEEEEEKEEEEVEEEEVEEESCSRDPDFDPGIEEDPLPSQKTQDRERERHRGLCPDCGVVYTVTKHQHECDHMFPCLDCGKFYGTDFALKAHRKRSHGNHQCRYCLKSFRKHSDYQNHEKNHSSEDKRAYKSSQCICSICFKKFTARHRLLRHEMSHNVEKPHRCQVCERMFAQASQLKSHLRVHTGERPFQCKFCLKSFNHNISLKNHTRRYHLGESDPSSDPDPRHPGKSFHSSDPDPKQPEETFHGPGPDLEQDPRKHEKHNPEPGSAQGCGVQGQRREADLRTEQERGKGGEVEDHVPQEQSELTLSTEGELGEGGRRTSERGEGVKQGKRYQSRHLLPVAHLAELEKEEEEEEEKEISNNSD